MTLFRKLLLYFRLERLIEQRSNQLDRLNETYVGVCESLLSTVQSALDTIATYENLQNEIAKAGKRNTDLITLEKLQDLLEAQRPADEQKLGDETKYIPALNDKQSDVVLKLVKKILDNIKSDYEQPLS